MSLDDAERFVGPDLLVVSPHRDGDRVVLEIVGELDLESRTLLATTAQAVLESSPRPARLAVDATGIEFVDSSGLATLLEIRDLACRGGVSFELTETSLPFQRVVELAGLHDVLFIST